MIWTGEKTVREFLRELEQKYKDLHATSSTTLRERDLIVHLGGGITPDEKNTKMLCWFSLQLKTQVIFKIFLV